MCPTSNPCACTYVKVNTVNASCYADLLGIQPAWLFFLKYQIKKITGTY